MTTTPDPIAAIERALGGVTHAPGPWVAEDAAVYCDDATGQRIADCKGEYLFWSKEKIQANAAYIAACNPVAITALLSLARQAAEKDAEIARLRKMVADCSDALSPFADSVFNDNGDMTVSLGLATVDDYVRAYFADRRARSLTTEISDAND